MSLTISLNQKGSLVLKKLFSRIKNWFGVDNSLAGLNIYWTFLTCCFHVSREDIVFSRESSPGISLVFI